MASNRHGKVTRSGFVYMIKVWNARGDQDSVIIKRKKLEEVKAIEQDIIGKYGIVRAECSGIYRTIFGMDEIEFYRRAQVLSSDPLDI